MTNLIERNPPRGGGVPFSVISHCTRWERLWGLSTRPRDRVQNGATPRYKSWANFLSQNQYRFCERVPISKRQCRPMMPMQANDANAGQWWQWCVTAELTNSGIGISEVRSLPSLDITGLVASPLTFDFPVRTCLPWKKQPARGVKCNEPAHRWWAGKMLLVGMISKSAPPSALFSPEEEDPHWKITPIFSKSWGCLSGGVLYLGC